MTHWPACRASEKALARRSLLALLGALATGACGALPPLDLKPPSLVFRDLQVRDVGLDTVRFDLIVDAQNPNAVDIPIQGLSVGLELLGVDVARGAAAESAFVLPKGATRQVPLAFSARTSDLLGLMRRLPGSLSSGLAYRLKGSASWGSSGIEIPFERQGSIDPMRSLRRILPLLRPDSPLPGGPGERT